MPVAVPCATTCIMASWMVWAVWALMGESQVDGWYCSTRLPSLSRTWSRTWGFMITPPSAMAEATSAICNGVARVPAWPMEAWPSRGSAPAKVVGNCEAAAPGRSMGGLASKPKAWAPAVILAPPMVSIPIWAKAELHDTSRMGTSVPPQASPPKLWMAWP